MEHNNAKKKPVKVNSYKQSWVNRMTPTINNAYRYTDLKVFIAQTLFKLYLINFQLLRPQYSIAYFIAVNCHSSGKINLSPLREWCHLFWVNEGKNELFRCRRVTFSINLKLVSLLAEIEKSVPLIDKWVWCGKAVLSSFA